MYFSGRVHSVLFEDPSQSFYILKMMLDKTSGDGKMNAIRSSGIQSVKGYIPGMTLKIGNWFGFDGEWVNDPKYGRQLNITKAPVFRDDWDADAIEQLMVGHGVARTVMQRVRYAVGDGLFGKTLHSVNDLKKAGLDDFTAAFVNQKWKMIQAYFKTIMFLTDLGLPGAKIKQVWSYFGDDATDILSTNPWALVELEGISFQQADEIAVRLQLDMGDHNRIRGALLYACRSQQNYSGHLFLRTGEILSHVQSMVSGVDGQTAARIMADLHNDKKVYIDRQTRPDTMAVYDIQAWDMERLSADMMMMRKKRAQFGKGSLKIRPYVNALASVGPKTERTARPKRVRLDTVVKQAVEEWGSYESLRLSYDQKQGVMNALKEPISILTGLPGTGKTTSLKAAVRILQESKIPFLLCAPTGIAAKNLASLTGARAYTIHRAFAARGGKNNERESIYAGIVGDSGLDVGGFDKNGVWGYGSDNTHPAEVVVVDESSMLDQHLFYRILHGTSSKCRLVFVGDSAQLPSVGPGNVLRDMINSDRFPVVHLTKIFRQKDTSGIVFAAHDIHDGQVPKCDPHSDFALVEVNGEIAARETIKTIASKLYSRRENFQVLSPRHKGEVGVTSLNTHLRELLNPQRGGLQELRMGKHGTMREDDRIMIVKNDYRMGVYNGDVGKIARIDRKAKEIELKIFGPVPFVIQVPYSDMSRLVRMAYACTVHKAQGLEYNYIVMPIMDSFRHQLQRNLLYTAVTRARSRVILVGTHSALASAVQNDKEDLRNTLLKDRLQSLISG